MIHNKSCMSFSIICLKIMILYPVKDTIASLIVYRHNSEIKLVSDLILTKFLSNLTTSALAKFLFSVSVN